MIVSRILRTGALAILTISFACSVSGQEQPTAHEVIDDYIEALGSEMVVRSLNSFKLSGTYNGNEMVVYYHEGMLHWVSRGGTYAYWFDYKERFWQRKKGMFSLRNDQNAGYPSRFMSLPVDALRWQDDDSLTISNLGSHSLGERQTWRLRFEKEGRGHAERFFDQQSGLLVQTTEADGDSNHYEYSQLGDYLFATKVFTGSVDDPSKVMAFENLEIEPSHEGVEFEMPAELKTEFDKLAVEKAKEIAKEIAKEKANENPREEQDQR